MRGERASKPAVRQGLGKNAHVHLATHGFFAPAGLRTVTSLWSVSDAATSVLMEEFYSRLWGNKPVGKLEALRQAQLFVLNNPGRVNERAKQLRAELLKRGVGESALEARGLGKEVDLPADRKTHV